MEEQTQIINKTNPVDEQEQPIKDSKIGNVSVRALIALILVSTVCVMCIAYVVCDVYVSILGKSVPTFSIQEPLYSGFMVAIGAYLGKQLSNKSGSGK